MININKQHIQIPGMNVLRLKEVKKEFIKKGIKTFQTAKNQRGDLSVTGYNNQNKDELIISDVIKRDGTEMQMRFYTCKPEANSDEIYKIVEFWDRINGNFEFNRCISTPVKKTEN